MTTERSGMSLSELANEILECKNSAGDSGNFQQADIYRRWILAIDAHLSRDAVVSNDGTGYTAEGDAKLTGIGYEVDGVRVAPERVSTFAFTFSHTEPFAARHASVPDGYVLVPVEPTEAMLNAAEKAGYRGYTGTWTISPLDCWKAMLAQRDGDAK